MILGGDEICRSQKGNNNAYCQDSEVSWFDWNLADEEKAMLEFTRRMIHFRKEHPALRRRHFFQGRSLLGPGKDISWLKPDGEEMDEQSWQNPESQAIGMLLSGTDIDEYNEHGVRIADETLLILFNASSKLVLFTIPGKAQRWKLVTDTHLPKVVENHEFDSGQT